MMPVLVQADFTVKDHPYLLIYWQSDAKYLKCSSDGTLFSQSVSQTPADVL